MPPSRLAPSSCAKLSEVYLLRSSFRRVTRECLKIPKVSTIYLLACTKFKILHCVLYMPFKSLILNVFQIKTTGTVDELAEEKKTSPKKDMHDVIDVDEADDEAEGDEDGQPQPKRFAAQVPCLLEVDKDSTAILAIDGGNLYRKLIGQHYVEMVTALLSPQSTVHGIECPGRRSTKALNSKVFGLFFVDHRLFVTSIDARLHNELYRYPTETAVFCITDGPYVRQENGQHFAFTCTPFYLNLFRAAHREAFAHYILYLIYCEHPKYHINFVHDSERD